jgi:hypothetical protein
MKPIGYLLAFLFLFSNLKLFSADDNWPYLLKFMIKKSDGTIAENEAVMWVGDESKLVKGVILTSMTRNEYEFTHDPTIRQMAAENGLAIIFMYSERQQDYFMGGSMSVFDPSLGHDSVLINILKDFAVLAGKPEIEHAPWLTFGHSTSGLFARYIAWWKPERMFGVILYKSGGYVPPDFVEDPDTATFLNIPWLSVAARNDKYGPGQDGWRNMRRDMMPWLEQGALMSEIVEPTMEEGHSVWRPFNAPYFAMWISKAVENKIPANMVASEQPVDLLHIDNETGMLSDSAVARLIDQEELSETLLRYQYDAEPEERMKMFWHFDDEMALTWVNYHHKNFGEYKPPRDTTLQGEIKYWRSKKPFESIPDDKTFVYGKSKNGEFDPSLGDQTLPDGTYSIKAFDRMIRIERQVPGDFVTPGDANSIIKSINGYDAMRMKQIIDESPDFIPNLEDVLSADVNMDGIINHMDFTNLVDRATGKIPEFKQLWNYQGGDIPVIMEPSVDYVFFDSSKTRFNLEARISKNYPDDDGKGYSRHRIPYISDELIHPYEIGNPYPAFYDATLFGVLLGDLDGTDALANSEVNENQTLILALGNSIAVGSESFKIPVYAEAVDDPLIYSVDLEIVFRENALNFLNTESQQRNDIYANFQNNTLTMISFTTDSYDLNEPVAWINSASANLEIEDILSFTAYVNGNKSNSEIKIHPLDIKNDIVHSSLSIYPNPVNDNYLTLDLMDTGKGPYTWKIYDSSGRLMLSEIFSGKFEDNKLFIDIGCLEKGLYIFQLKTETGYFRSNFVKN